MPEGATQVEAVHRLQAPTRFIWKYIFSLDHKVIGIQYFMLALFSVIIGMILSLLIRIRLVWPEAAIPGSGSSLTQRGAGRGDDAGVLPLPSYHSRHHHGVLRLDHSASGRLRQLFSSHPDRRRGHGLPPAEYALVLDYVPRPGDPCWPPSLSQTAHPSRVGRLTRR